MANYATLKAAVQSVVKTNGNAEITGENLQSTLFSIIDSLGVGYQFMGVATPETTPPASPDYNIAYIGGAGTYSNFGTTVTVAGGSISVFKYNGSWTHELINDIDYIPKSFAAVVTNTATGELNYFNINNTQRKLNYPTFYIARNKLEKSTCLISISEGSIDISNLPDGKSYYLVVDKSGNVSVVKATNDIVDKYLIAYIKKDSTLSSGKFVDFRGCEGGLHGEYLWRIDGKYIIDEIQEKENILQNGSLTTVYDDVVMYKPGIEPSSDYPSGYQSDMNTIRVLVNVSPGQYVTASMILNRGVAALVYPSRIHAIRGGVTLAIQNITDGGFVNNIEETEITVNGILSFTMRKADGSVFSLEEYNIYLAALKFTLRQYGTEVLNNKILNRKPLFIGSLAQKSVGSTKLSDNDDTTRVSMISEVCLPYEEIKIHIKIKEGYYFGVKYGSIRSTLAETKEWYKNGDTVIIPKGYLYYRCYFAKGDSQTDAVTVSEIQSLIDKKGIEISFNDFDYDIISASGSDEKYLKSMIRYFFDDEEAGTRADALQQNGLIPNIATFGHASDIHGDVKRYAQFLDYCDYLGVDAALISGDFVAVSPLQSCQFINDVADKHTSMVLPCTGNHDCLHLYTAQEQRAQIVGYLMDKNNVVTNPLEDYPTYFYKDIDDKNIRIISVNLYEGNHEDYKCNFTEKQANWFISSLASTPANYGVIVMLHSPEDKPNVISGFDKFYQNKYAYPLGFQSGITGKPFSKIIDAFISKTTATITYTSNSVEITVNPDFRNINSGVEFITYVAGHEHVDWVGVVPDTVNRQLVLNVTCTCICGPSGDPYGANLSDLPRDGIGSTQDAFNIYGIDRVNGSVRIARVGSNINYMGIERKFMIVQYR